MARKHLHKMQYLREVVQQLRHEGLTSVNLFQPSGSTALHRATNMWMYLGPSCPDCPFTDELGDAKINTRIHKVLAHGADLNPGAGPTPLREGVDCTRESPLRPVFNCLCQFQFLNALKLLVGSRVCS
jgi:hypothetical protein